MASGQHGGEAAAELLAGAELPPYNGQQYAKVRAVAPRACVTQRKNSTCTIASQFRAGCVLLAGPQGVYGDEAAGKMDDRGAHPVSGRAEAPRQAVEENRRYAYGRESRFCEGPKSSAPRGLNPQRALPWPPFLPRRTRGDQDGRADSVACPEVLQQAQPRHW